MTKHSLSSAIAHRLGIARSRASLALDVVRDCISDALSRGEKACLPGVARFRSAIVEERPVRDPKNGRVVRQPRHRQIRCRVSAHLRAELFFPSEEFHASKPPVSDPPGI